ncbi:hypothetical protein ACIQZO_40250 [Streptomyces sp. NPDC097617]|uniref:hypothetical protein n=1 Tax=Streptomyces sp. NPDC097617 TaxID=3366091 RepID=UPI003815FFEE
MGTGTGTDVRGLDSPTAPAGQTVRTELAAEPKGAAIREMALMRSPSRTGLLFMISVPEAAAATNTCGSWRCCRAS